jgi:hypothetical protein
MCRASWKNESLPNYLDIKSELDGEAMQTYLDWLYTSTFCISENISRSTDAFNLVILKLWAVANAVEDQAFKSQVIVTYFEEARARFWNESVKWAFVDRQCDDEIRSFIIDMSLPYIEPGWFKNDGKNWPEAFVSELADVAMVQWRDRKGGRALRKIWMKKLKVEVDLVSDDDVTVPVGGKKASASTTSGIPRDKHRAVGMDSTMSKATRLPATWKRSGQTVQVTKRIGGTDRQPKQDARFSFLSDDSDDGELIVLRSEA